MLFLPLSLACAMLPPEIRTFERSSGILVRSGYFTTSLSGSSRLLRWRRSDVKLSLNRVNRAFNSRLEKIRA